MNTLQATQSAWVERATAKHGGRYDYANVRYVNARTKVEIVCPEHGGFLQAPFKHVSGQGCPKCAGNNAVTPDEFLERARAVHGDRYEYPGQFRGMFHEMRIMCREHGEFEQLPASHIHKKTGCPKCASDVRAAKQSGSTEWFISAATAQHGGAYDYSRVVYRSSAEKVEIVCPEHGGFLQAPSRHLMGQGCPVCGERKKGSDSKTTEQFVVDARRVHGDTYDYSRTVYRGARTPLTIVCPVHGEFEQTPDAHLAGKGCSRCVHQVSRWEMEIQAYLQGIGADVRQDRSVIRPYEIDLFSGEHGVGVECHGLYFHSTKFVRGSARHLRKHVMADRAGIRLIQVFEDEWKYRESAVKNLLAAAFGVAGRVQARHCAVVTVPWAEARDFFERVHIQGAPRGGVCYGLRRGDDLVAVMAFTKVVSERGAVDAGWELVRYASEGVVSGGASRLFTAFLRAHSPERVVSYSDRRLFAGGMYELLGFRRVHHTRPNYSVLVGDRRRHKAGFKKALLAKNLGIEVAGRTEREICEEHGWYRVYDCGLTKWEFLA